MAFHLSVPAAAVALYGLALLTLVTIDIRRKAEGGLLQRRILSANLDGGEIGPRALRFVGTVEGKSYFTDLQAYMNWTDASTYCQAAQLELASIETEEQMTFLINSLGELGLEAYWLSARESRKPSMFVWDGSGRELDESIVKNWTAEEIRNLPYQLCTQMIVDREEWLVLAYGCNEVVLRPRPLCATKSV